MGVADGHVVIITGAGRGLGWGVARGFAREGGRVALVDRTTDELDQALAQTQAEGGETIAIRCDVTDPQAVQAMVEQVATHWGRIDTLINNAAVLLMRSFEDTSLDVWDTTLNVNLRAPYLCARAVYPYLKAGGGGHIINVSSAASRKGFVDETAYCAAKWGLTGFTQALALEGRAFRIAVNEMGPGILIKPTSLSLADAEQADAEVRGRWHDPIVMAEGFIWLARQDPTRVTGRRFNSYQVAEGVRRDGWDVAIEGFSPEVPA